MLKVLIILHLIKYMIVETTIIDPNISNDQNKELISHGELFDIQKYPYMVYFESKKFATLSFSSCSGSLILPLFVLTAAHCTYEVDKYNIVVTNTFNMIQKIYIICNYYYLSVIYLLFNNFHILKIKMYQQIFLIHITPTTC